MAKKIIKYDTKLDRQVVRYLAAPVVLDDITDYEIRRDTSGTTRLTVTIITDSERFDACADEKE